MATQFSTLLKVALPTQGELSGSWGTTINENITKMVEEAIAGTATINTWSGNSATLSTANGTTAESRNAILNLTDTGTSLSGAATVIVPALSKIFIVKNGTAQTVTVKTASGTGIAITSGSTGYVYCDGTNVVEGQNYVAGNFGVGGNLTVTGTTTFNGGTVTLGDADTDNIVFGGEIDSNIIPDDDGTYDLGSASKEWKDIYIDGVAYLDAINFNGTAITATAAELNIMDGVTSTAAELNILDGVTSTAAELNILDGVTSTTAELNILDGVTSTTAELNIIDGGTSATSTTVADADRVVLNDNGTMVQVAVTDLAAYFDDEITAMPNLVTTAATTVGALNSGSITSGFGTIDTGSSTITTTGLITGGSLDIDDVVINGSTIGHTDDTDLITVASGVVTVAGELDAVSLDISGDADIDGTLEADAITIAGVTLAETISDTVGAMVTSNTETGVTVTYDDADNTLDFVIGTLNQDTTGNAATATALETARTIHGVSFDGSADIDLSEVISDTVGAMVSSNTETGIAVAYQDADNTIDFTLGTAQTTIESVKNTSLAIGRDDDNLIKFSTDDQIIFEVAGGDNVIFKASGEIEASSLDISGNVDIDGTLETDALSIASTAITATAAELNILDGVTSTATELNILDGVTSTTAELNVLDGITAVVGELNALDLGSTAVGTAVASKAMILDSNKDYTGVRNFTLTGNLTIPDDGLFAATNTAGNLLVADGTNFNSIAVSSLSEISTVASGDVFLAIDASGGGLKKITRSTIVSGLATSSGLSNVVEDTSPQLGGNLDMNGADIVTTSNATIDLAPNGTGTVVVRGNTNSGAIVFNCESNSHGQKVMAQPHSAGVTNTLLLPAGANSTLVSLVSTDTLTNKTLTSPKINEDVAVTSTATELNLLDGVTATTAELNILDGVTSTAAELNILDGVTSTTAELNILDGVTSTAAELNALDGITAVVGELNALDLGSTAVGTAIASKAVILDSNKDYTGIRNFSITGNLSVGGTTTVVDTVTMNAQNAVLFEGATADAHETTLTIVDPTADRTINLPNQSGTVAVLAAASNTAITSTPEELNILDGVTSTAAELNILDGVTSTTAELNILDGVTSTAAELNILDGVTSTAAELNVLDGITAVVGELNALDLGSTAVGTAIASKAVILDSNKDYTGIRNFTLSGELDAGSLDVSGNADIDGTLEADAITVNGTALATVIAGTTVTDATNSAHVLVTDNESTNEENLITFVEGATSSTGNVGLEMDGNFAYNPSTGTVTATIFKGNIDAVDGDFDGTLEADAISIGGTTITSTAAELNVLDGITAVVGELNALDLGSTAVGTAIASKAMILDSNKDYTGVRNFTLSGELDAGSLDISGNADIDGTLETDALSINGTAVTSTAAELNILDGVTSTAAELNVLDGITAVVGELNALDLGLTAVGTAIASKAMILDSNKDYTGVRNFTLSGELDAGSLDVSGDADIDGTLEADAITVNGTALAEVISDTTGAMFSSNTETGITATYQDADNTIDLAIAAAQTTITSLLATDIKIGEDDQTKIDFETANEIHFYAANVEQVYLGDNIFGPQSDSDVDLGSNSVRWKDAYVDSVTVTGDVAVGDDITVAGRAVGTMTTDNDGSFDLAVSNDFKCTPSGNFTLTFTNGDVGQSGNIILINSGGHTVAAHADIAINADTLTALSTAGTYHLAYFCSADSGTSNTITVAATGALT